MMHLGRAAGPCIVLSVLSSGRGLYSDVLYCPGDSVGPVHHRTVTLVVNR